MYHTLSTSVCISNTEIRVLWIYEDSTSTRVQDLLPSTCALQDRKPQSFFCLRHLPRTNATITGRVIATERFHKLFKIQMCDECGCTIIVELRNSCQRCQNFVLMNAHACNFTITNLSICSSRSARHTVSFYCARTTERSVMSIASAQYLLPRIHLNNVQPGKYVRLFFDAPKHLPPCVRNAKGLQRTIRFERISLTLFGRLAVLIQQFMGLECVITATRVTSIPKSTRLRIYSTKMSFLMSSKVHHFL